MASFASLCCLVQELNNYLTLETQTSLVVDRSAQGDLLRINFNISFPSLSCEFATLDVSDALGTVGHEHCLGPQANVHSNIFMFGVDRNG